MEVVVNEPSQQLQYFPVDLGRGRGATSAVTRPPRRTRVRVRSAPVGRVDGQAVRNRLRLLTGLVVAWDRARDPSKVLV